MVILLQTYDAAQQGALLLQGAPGESIRILAILTTSWASVSVQLISMVGGDDPVSLTAPMHVGSSRASYVKLDREYAVVAGAGRDVHVTTAYLSTVYPVSLMIWYERVPA